jgi:hypothetical protein
MIGANFISSEYPIRKISRLVLHRLQKVKHLTGKVVFPDLVDWVVDAPELLELPVLLRAEGNLPRSGARTSNQRRARRDAEVVEVGLHCRQRGWELRVTVGIISRGDGMTENQYSRVRESLLSLLSLGGLDDLDTFGEVTIRTWERSVEEERTR